jgi:hypothetical protein
MALSLFVQASGQSVHQRSADNNFHGVTLTFLSQRCLPRDKVPYVGDDFIDFSDLVTRFRLENKGPEEVYYLANNILNSIEPVGFQLSRNGSGASWDAIYSPARGREGIFTGIAYSWFSLGPGLALEFERRDVSFKEPEHATSVFLNLKPEHKGRVELVSNAFVVKACRKGDK